MSQIKERSTISLQYETLEDLLKVIVYSAQSSLRLTPMLYYISYRNQEILFILTEASGGIIINYIIQNEKPSKKFIELKRLSGEFSFVDNIGSDTQSLHSYNKNPELHTYIFYIAFYVLLVLLYSKSFQIHIFVVLQYP